MKTIRRMLVVLALVFGLSVPLATVSAPAAHAQSPLGCWTDTFWQTILCYRINGPNGTDLVYNFYYSYQNVGSHIQLIDVEVTGASGLWGPVLDVVYPHRFESGALIVGHYVLPSNYCIHFFSRWHVTGKCFSVHPG